MYNLYLYLNVDIKYKFVKVYELWKIMYGIQEGIIIIIIIKYLQKANREFGMFDVWSWDICKYSYVHDWINLFLILEIYLIRSFDEHSRFAIVYL